MPTERLDFLVDETNGGSDLQTQLSYPPGNANPEPSHPDLTYAIASNDAASSAADGGRHEKVWCTILSRAIQEQGSAPRRWPNP